MASLSVLSTLLPLFLLLLNAGTVFSFNMSDYHPTDCQPGSVYSSKYSRCMPCNHYSTIYKFGWPERVCDSIVEPVGLGSPDEKFASCCHDAYFSEETVDTACHYPADNPLPIVVRQEIGRNFNPYVGCYTAHKDNRECCIKGGVVGQFKICQDLCDGTHPHDVSMDYYVCVAPRIVAAMSDCNKIAWDKSQIWQGEE